ncbi:MAG: RluA family pseudouridine synthase [Desulfuromonadaceae bacterium]|nr:RluA family pseudouridine synthase [Desulfuromonadaceae bacterium]MDD2849514.1 RluA family pseudouridine synthase [Desulfuromonadaceae bacterium]MDD4131940.1 RluA family pseudouridine synthase [Desulfuromonadaceae bacterium]
MILRKNVGKEQSGFRLDDAIAVLCTGVSKTEARRIIDRGGCTVNVALVRVASRSVKTGDVIEIGVMEAGRFQELQLPSEALLYEDAELIAVNKPAGINSQRTPYQLKGTLEYWVTEYFKAQGSSEPARVVHRLDRGTSGAMLFPKNRQAAARLSKQFQDGQVDKRYLALVSGRPDESAWTVDAPIGKIASARYGVVEGGKASQTEFRTLASSGELSLVEARPLTGRTHQIRVHLESVGLPIVGDATYGGQAAGRMMLHCSAMTFQNAKLVEVTVSAPLDGEFAGLASTLMQVMR